MIKNSDLEVVVLQARQAIKTNNISQGVSNLRGVCLAIEKGQRSDANLNLLADCLHSISEVYAKNGDLPSSCSYLQTEELFLSYIIDKTKNLEEAFRCMDDTFKIPLPVPDQSGRAQTLKRQAINTIKQQQLQKKKDLCNFVVIFSLFLMYIAVCIVYFYFQGLKTVTNDTSNEEFIKVLNKFSKVEG